MMHRTSALIGMMAVGSVCAILLVHAGVQQDSDATNPSSSHRVCVDVDARIASPGPGPYGKIRPPAEILLDVANAGPTGGPVTLTVSAVTSVPLESATVTLHVPPIAGEPARTETLWSCAPSGPVAEQIEYSVPAAPDGEYRFLAVLEFKPEGTDRMIGISQALCLDVRPDRVLSSNVSFRQIERVELLMELERRVVRQLQPGISIAGADAVTDELERLEAARPGLVGQVIEHIKAHDPDVARRIRELNEVSSEPPDNEARGVMPAVRSAHEEG